MEKIRVPAPAKINLSLDIKGLRPDGFHELEMIMQTISLHDVIDIKKVTSGIIIDSTDKRLPTGRNNLAYQAAEMLLNRVNKSRGVSIFIDKKIPVAAGLAGGSTDAAAVLKGVNRLYNLNYTDRELKEIGAKIGSDVPYCLRGGTALATGRGIKIKQLPDINKQQLIIVCPPFEISTALIYKDYDRIAKKQGIPSVSTDKLIRLIQKNKKINWDEGWNNVLEQITIHRCRAVKEIKDILLSMGAKFALMSGSGPSVFAVFNDQEMIKKVVDEWPRTNDFLFTAWTVSRDFPELRKSRG